MAYQEHKAAGWFPKSGFQEATIVEQIIIAVLQMSNYNANIAEEEGWTQIILGLGLSLELWNSHDDLCRMWTKKLVHLTFGHVEETDQI